MSELISPIEFIKSELISVSLILTPRLVVHEEVDLSDTENRLQVERKSGIGRNDEGFLVCDCALYAKVDIVDSKEEGNADEPLVSFSCMMRALSKSPEMADDETLSEQILEANTIAFIWAKMRSWMEMLTADSAISKKVSLPALDPYSLVIDGDEGPNAEDDEGGLEEG